MKAANVRDTKEWFQVLQTSEKSQTAVMTLEPGGASGSKPNEHKSSEQVLLVLEGEVEAEMGAERRHLETGDVVLIPAGVKHRFSNRGERNAITFNVYSPPEYPPGTQG